MKQPQQHRYVHYIMRFGDVTARQHVDEPYTCPANLKTEILGQVLSGRSFALSREICGTIFFCAVDMHTDVMHASTMMTVDARYAYMYKAGALKKQGRARRGSFCVSSAHCQGLSDAFKIGHLSRWPTDHALLYQPTQKKESER